MIGAGQVLGSFQARLGLDSSDYAKGIINAESVSRIFGQTFATFVSNPLLGSIDILKRFGSAMITNSALILEQAEATERLSQQTGASEQLLIAATKRLEIAGFTAERTRQSFQFLTKFIADLNKDGPLSAEVLGQLGISLEGLRNTDDIFRALVEGLDQIPDAAMRSAIAARIFGEEAGPQMVNAIGGGNDAIDEMIDQYTRLGFVIDRGANTQLAAMNTNIGFLNQAIEGIKLNFVRELLLGINEQMDFTNEGIVKMADNINNDLGPAARDLGTSVQLIGEVLEKIAWLARKGQSIREEIYFQKMRLDESFRQSLDDGPDAAIRAAQRRNRERGQEYLETEMGL